MHEDDQQQKSNKQTNKREKATKKQRQQHKKIRGGALPHCQAVVRRHCHRDCGIAEAIPQCRNAMGGEAIPVNPLVKNEKRQKQGGRLHPRRPQTATYTSWTGLECRKANVQGSGRGAALGMRLQRNLATMRSQALMQALGVTPLRPLIDLELRTSLTEPLNETTLPGSGRSALYRLEVGQR